MQQQVAIPTFKLTSQENANKEYILSYIGDYIGQGQRHKSSYEQCSW